MCREVSVSIQCFDWSKMAAEGFPVARINEYAKPCEPAIHVLRSVVIVPTTTHTPSFVTVAIELRIFVFVCFRFCLVFVFVCLFVCLFLFFFCLVLLLLLFLLANQNRYANGVSNMGALHQISVQ